MLYVELERGGKVIETQRVLNEAVVNKGALARMIELELSIDGGLLSAATVPTLDRCKSNGLDGLFPLGRWPIVHPGVESFIITPICAHMLSDRPLVVRDSSFHSNETFRKHGICLSDARWAEGHSAAGDRCSSHLQE